MSIAENKVFWTQKTDCRISDLIYNELISNQTFEICEHPEIIAKLAEDIESADFDAIKNKLLVALQEIQSLSVSVS